MRIQTKENLGKEAEFKEKERLNGEILDKTTQDSQIELPDILIESELDKMIEEYKNKIEMQGLKFEDYLNQIGKSAEEIKKGWRVQAEEKVRVSLVIREIAQVEKIKVDDKEIDEKVDRLTQSVISGLKDAKERSKYLEKLGSKESREYFESIIRNQKTVERLVEMATGAD